MPWNRYLEFFSIAALGCLADLWTKDAVFHWLGMPPDGQRWWIWRGYVGFETALNSGAVFGLGAGYTSLFSALSVVAAIGILVWLFVFRAACDRLLTVALACVMGGIAGNLYDRLGLWQVPGQPGERVTQVRDWILFRYQEYTWPNFNIADCLLVTGSILLVWHGLGRGDVAAGPIPREGVEPVRVD